MSRHCWPLELLLLLTPISLYSCSEAVCKAQAKGDNSCEEEELGASAGSCSEVTPLSYGDRRWQDFDWRVFQHKDITEDDTQNPLKRFSLNVVTSSKLPPNRSIPDNRDEECQHVQYGSELAQSSVIITFRTEARSTLLRTVVSVLERTPGELLREIILVDDNNEDETVGKKLASIGKVRLIRNSRREGLIRSRNIASKVARGEVLVFLDSHCEVETDWLQPLLQRIKLDRKTVASPVIDNINLNTFNLEPVSTHLRGGFDWRFEFFWEFLPAYDRAQKLLDPTWSVKTPAVAGGLFAVDRSWFEELGWYDEGMEIWGGENIEMSLRVWMCGGQMEIVPCSKVGHVYKKSTPYSYPKDQKKTIGCNNWRVASVWLEEFQELYHHLSGGISYNSSTCGDISDRLALKEELKCHDFHWFLTNVYPELQLPKHGDLSFGTLHTSLNGWLTCVDPVSHPGELSLGAAPCLQSHHPQHWRHTAQGRLQQDDFCITLSSVRPGGAVLQSLCGRGEEGLELQGWRRVRPGRKVQERTRLRGQLYRNIKHDLCLDYSQVQEVGLKVMRCDMESPTQRLQFQYNAP